MNNALTCMPLKPHTQTTRRWADGDIFVKNFSVTLESIVDKYGRDPDTHIIITKDCLTINGACFANRQLSNWAVCSF